jgi:hypothetical protein
MIAPPKRPAQDELEALMKEARARQLRRRLLGAAGVAIAAALALAIYAVTLGSGSSQSVRSAPLGPGGVPFCRSAQISSNLDIPDGLTGLTAWLILANHGTTPCSLPLGPPTVQITWHGSVLPTHEVHGRDLLDASWEPIRIVRVLQPKQRAAINFDWKNFCGTPRPSNGAVPTYRFRFDRALVLTTPFGPPASCLNPGAPPTLLVSRPILVRS